MHLPFQQKFFLLQLRKCMTTIARLINLHSENYDESVYYPNLLNQKDPQGRVVLIF